MKAKNVIINQIKKHFLNFGVLLFGNMLSGGILGVAYTEVIRQITDAIWKGEYQYLCRALLLFAVLIIVHFLLTIIQYRCSYRFKENIVCAMEDAAYYRFAGKEYWTRKEQEDMLGGVCKIIPDAVDLLYTQMINTCLIIVIGISGFLYGISINPSIFLIAIVVTCILVLFIGRKNSKLPELYREVGELKSKRYNLLWEQVKNREIAGFMNQEKVGKGYEEECRKFLTTLLRIKKVTNGPELFSQFGSTILIVLISGVGGSLVIREKMSFADLLALIMLIQVIASRFFGIPEIIQGWKNLKGNCMNIDSLLQEDGQKCGISMLNDKISEITLKDLSFSYSSKEEMILKKVNLKLTGGTFYAIAGASGCGKSTLLRLITRLLPNWQGEICVNSYKLEEMKRRDYWQHLTYVEQTPVIIHGTLLYNITLEESQWDQERLKKAISDAALDYLVNKLPDGLWTVISEKQL